MYRMGIEPRMVSAWQGMSDGAETRVILASTTVFVFSPVNSNRCPSGAEALFARPLGVVWLALALFGGYMHVVQTKVLA